MMMPSMRRATAMMAASGDRDSPWHGALGRKGPNPAEAAPGVTTCQIPSDPAYGHGDDFPPGNGGGGRGGTGRRA